MAKNDKPKPALKRTPYCSLCDDEGTLTVANVGGPAWDTTKIIPCSCRPRR